MMLSSTARRQRNHAAGAILAWCWTWKLVNSYRNGSLTIRRLSPDG